MLTYNLDSKCHVHLSKYLTVCQSIFHILTLPPPSLSLPLSIFAYRQLHFLVSN